MIRPAVRYYLCVVVIASPLPLGSNRQWAIDVLLAATLVVAAATCLAQAASHRCRKSSRIAVFATVPLVLWIAFVLVQVVVGRVIAGDQSEVIRHGGDVLAAYFAAPWWLPFSLDPTSSINQLQRSILYLLLFVLALYSVRSSRHVRLLLWAFMVSALTQVGISFFEHLQQAELFNTTKKLGDITGSFANRNHFAGYLASAAAAAFGVVIARVGPGDSHTMNRYRHAIARLLDMLMGPTFLLFLVAMVMTGAAAVSGSRGAVLALFGGLVLGVVWRLIANRGQGAFSMLVVTSIVGAVAFITLNETLVLSRLAELVDGIGRSGRLGEWQLAVRAILERPIAGYGVGSLIDGLSVHRNGALPTLTYDHVHNVYIEILVESGLIGFGLLGWFVLQVLAATSANLRARSTIGAEYSFAALLSLLVMLLHAFVEFNLKIPSVTTIFIIVSGAMLAEARAIRSYARR